MYSCCAKCVMPSKCIRVYIVYTGKNKCRIHKEGVKCLEFMGKKVFYNLGGDLVKK